MSEDEWQVSEDEWQVFSEPISREQIVAWLRQWGPYRELEAENAQLRNIARAAETLLAPINRPLGDLGVAEEALREALAVLDKEPA